MPAGAGPKALGDLEPVHGLGPVEILGHQPRLVAGWGLCNAIAALAARQLHGAHGGDLLHGLWI
jgi:hypothetical protein